ncbi:MAG TPA: protein kinase, partial [Thermoanaerobaculia bacterium]|nr:protein kinase [Thermoanaerobaculia bacterium]
MTIQPGTRLGPYEIAAPIGAGGMGEVWRARDTRLEREVAIKVLPPELAEDAQFLKRFEREAKTISQLSHPHVCALYDVGEEKTGASATVHYLVMELLEGESLAERIEKGRLPLDDVLKYGREIASALDAAHRRGITHRDLKPGNIMLTKSGAKLLDFGLAKSASEGQAPIDGLTNLKTEAKPLTQEGTILGTFQYMAPEQLEGLEADARTDIFALGAVLYEMATGHRAFEAQSKTSLIAAIVSSQPEPISKVVAMSPPSLDHVVRRCLEKDPDDRWQSAHDVASQLQWISEAGSQAGVATPITIRRKTRERLAWAAAAILGITTIVVSLLWLRAPEVQKRSFRLTIPSSTSSYQQAGQGIISPDGARVIFTAMSPERKWSLWLRDLDSFDARAIDGTKRGVNGFWSPDGRSFAYWSGGNLMSIDLDGGSPQTIAPASWLQGGDWNKDGVIIFGVGESGILRVQAT